MEHLGKYFQQGNMKYRKLLQSNNRKLNSEYILQIIVITSVEHEHLHMCSRNSNEETSYSTNSQKTLETIVFWIYIALKTISIYIEDSPMPTSRSTLSKKHTNLKFYNTSTHLKNFENSSLSNSARCQWSFFGSSLAYLK